MAPSASFRSFYSPWFSGLESSSSPLFIDHPLFKMPETSSPWILLSPGRFSSLIGGFRHAHKVLLSAARETEIAMGRERGSDPAAVATSSIALLQERFRQLQKEKEMREGRENHLICVESEHRSMRVLPRQSQQLPSPGRRSLPDLVHPARPFQAPAGSLRHNATVDASDPPRVAYWPDNFAIRSNMPDDDEVDTSLHL